jgi:uncharacterized protein
LILIFAGMEPVAPAQRIQSLDVVRGVALLGILLMNVVSFSLPDPAYWDPSGHGGDTGWNLHTYFLNSLLVDGSMRAIFSMLFGAGVILFTASIERKGDSSASANLWYRRTIWLIIFGMLHAYLLLFPGEILFYYGIAGLFIFPARHASPRRLLLFSLFLIAILSAVRVSEYHTSKRLFEETVAAEKALAEGIAVTPEQQTAMAKWYYKYSTYKPDSTSRERVISAMRGGYRSAMANVVPYVRFMQTEYLYRFGFLDTLSMMLFGMALFRWGVLQGTRKIRFYLGMVAVGYGIGIPVNWIETSTYLKSGFDLLTYFRISQSYDVGRIFTALGHLGLILLCLKWGRLSLLKRAVGAVGRMALSNYVMHTMVGAFIFIGLKQYGQWERYQLYYLVAGIWVFQLIVSPVWLRHFHYGPLEWVWRRLTYGRGIVKFLK